MEIIIIINGNAKRYNFIVPKDYSDNDTEDWLFSELEQSKLKQGNKLKGKSLGKLNYICDLKCKEI